MNKVNDIVDDRYRLLSVNYVRIKNHSRCLVTAECLKCGFIYRNPIDINDLKNTVDDCSKHRSRRWKNKRIKNIFSGMKKRCYNESDCEYHRYGGRGIEICNEWLTNPWKFEDWSLSHGYDDNLTIDRIDNNGDYYPENCRWITLSENAKWSSHSNAITVNGITDTILGWGKRINGTKSTIVFHWINSVGLDETIKRIKFCLDNPDKKARYWSKSKYITVDNRSQSISRWAKELGMCVSSLTEYRRNHGDEALSKHIKNKLEALDNE